MEDIIIKIIANLGFPIAISVFLLVYFQKTLKELTKAIKEELPRILGDKIDKNTKAMEKNTRVFLAVLSKMGADEQVLDIILNGKEKE